jgi:predicted  nucleic acid-binding Zn-ribbon protein
MERRCANCGSSILCQFLSETEIHFYNELGNRIDHCPECGAPLPTTIVQETEARIEPKNAA